LLDLSAGEVQLFFATLATGNATLQTGRIKAIGVTSPRRLPALPDVPTVAESGFDDLRVEQWWGLVAPAKISAEILENCAPRLCVRRHPP
jgi:tripartite-type tricarboxylate transporter receptor subunit TctC